MRTAGKSRTIVVAAVVMLSIPAWGHGFRPGPRLGWVETTAIGLADPGSAARKGRAPMGHCTVSIAGTVLDPATHVILIPDHPTPQEDFAARDLETHIERVTGHALPIVKPGEAGGRSWIFVGWSWLASSAGFESKADRLGVEGTHIAVRGPNVLLEGNRRGVLYAVYSFLEDQLGCRWFTPDCSTWPTEGCVDVPEGDWVYVPPLEYRATDYPSSRPPEFAVRNKLNGTQIEANEAWGGKISYRGFVHTFNALVPPETYFAEHPEYFSEVGGKRTKDYSQLCLTNPDVLRIATETVLRWIKESPEATIISVSQNDWHNPCQCAKCSALAEEEGAQSGPLLHFVNAIADAVAKDHPNIIIDTLAYQYTRKPPKHVRPRPNVAIRLCSIECEFNRPLAGSPYNASFVDDIRGWHAICDRLHIWDYVINYAHCVQPFPNLKVLQPNIRFFVANGVTGVYEEANYFSRGGELAELRTYLMAKLLWNPDTDVDRATREFLAAYYGAAAAKIAEYIDETHRLAVSDPEFHMPIYVAPRSPFQTPEALKRFGAMFDEAERLVTDDPVCLHRVAVARLPMLYTEIVHASGVGYVLKDDALVPSSAADVGPALESFERIARAEGLTAVSEGGVGSSLEGWLNHVRGGIAPRKVLRLRGGGLEVVVVPELGGRILSLRRESDGRELLQVVRHGQETDPTGGGYEEFSQADYRSPGWSEPYDVVASDARSVTLRATLKNGLRLERRYELDASRAALSVRSEVTNTASAPRTACLRVHPAFRLDAGARARLLLGPPSATATAVPDALDGAVERWFRGAELPPGSWTLVDETGGVTITSIFSPDEVEACYFNRGGADNRANLELWSHSRELAPGQSLVVSHRYEIGTP